MATTTAPQTLPIWREWLSFSPVAVRLAAVAALVFAVTGIVSTIHTMVNDRATGTIVGLMAPEERTDWRSDETVFDQTDGALNRRALLRIDEGPRSGDYVRVHGVPVRGPREGDRAVVRLRGEGYAAWGPQASPGDFAMALACLALCFATGLYAVSGTQDWLKSRGKRA